LSEKIDKRAWQTVLVVVAVLALAYGAFELGRTSAGYFVVSSMLERLDHRKGKGVAQGLYDEGKTIAKVPGSST